ncbi:MAG: hypothetical protein ACE15B_10630 [Bryobacteraceae bacterium]
MKVLPYGNRKVLVPAVCVLAACLGAILLIPGTKPLYGQADGDKIPDMVGIWRGETYACVFANVTDPECKAPADIAKAACQPQFVAQPEAQFEVTTQNGRAFAGLYVQGVYPRRLTGVVSPDGTVIVQGFSPTEFRSFASGTLKIADGIYEITGQGHGLDDFGLRTPGNAVGSMSSFIFRYTKAS